MTYREFLTNVVAMIAIAEGVNTEAEKIAPPTVSPLSLMTYAKSELIKLDIKNDKRKNTLSKNQTENEALKAEMLEEMKDETIYTAAELAKAFNVSTQKISALCKQLVDKKLVEVIDGYKPEGAKSKVKGYKKV